jgi:single-strand DNA-binding protein
MKHIGLATLGRDAEIRRTPDGTAVANLSLAVTVFDKEAEGNRGTQWIDASLWGNQAEKLTEYMTKGSRHCFTLSDLKMEKYADKDGYDAYKLTARVDSVELGPKREGATSSGGSAGGSTGQRRPASATQAAGPAPASKPAKFDDMDDDIPF